MGFTLPDSLRLALSGQKLPAWACDICNVSHESTIDVLPSNIATATAGDGRALEHYFTTLLTRRMNEKELKSKKCLPYSNFLLTLDLVEQMNVSNRTRNCLARYVKSEPDGVRLNQITFGDLTSIRNMGSKSVIEFLAYMQDNKQPEDVTDPDGETRNLQVNLDNLVFELRWQPWIRGIICGDARFPELMRPIGGVHLQQGENFESLLESLADFSQNHPPPLIAFAIEVLESIQSKVEALEKLPLDSLLKNYIDAHLKRSKQHILRAVYARFGLTREGCLTLEEAGKIASVTRERIRQIEKKILDRLQQGDYPTFMPRLNEAVSLLNSSIGVNVLEYSDILQYKGITSSPVSADAIILFAKMCNLDGADIEIKRISDKSRIISKDNLNVNRIFIICRRLFSRNGIADITVAARHFDTNAAEFTKLAKGLLDNTTMWKALDDDKRWWVPTDDIKHSRNRLINIARKVLCVSNPVSVDELREGYLKAARLRNSSNEVYSGEWEISVPSRSAMLLFFKQNDGFTVNGEMISTDEILDYRLELGDVERTMVEVFLNSSTGVLRRNDILRECVKRGINENSLMIYTTYSPIIQHLAQETFKLIGKFVPVEALNAHQAALSQKIRTKRILVSDWKNGRIRLCIRCPEQITGMVVGAPSSVRDLLKSKKFEAYDLEDNRMGTIGSNEDGVMWGMGTFCAANGLEENDILTVEFDIASMKAYLSRSVLSEILDDIE